MQMETSKIVLAAQRPMLVLSRRLNLALLGCITAWAITASVVAIMNAGNTRVLYLNEGSLISVDDVEFANSMEQFSLLKDFIRAAYGVGGNAEVSKKKVQQLVSEELIKRKNYDLSELFDRAQNEGLEQQVSVSEIKALESNEWNAKLDLIIKKAKEPTVKAKLDLRLRFQKRARTVENWRGWEVSDYDEKVIH